MIQLIFSFFEIGQGRELSDEEYTAIKNVVAFESLSALLLLIISIW